MGFLTAIEGKARIGTAVSVAVLLIFGVLGALTVDPYRGTQEVRTAAPPTTAAPGDADESIDDTTTTTAAPQATTTTAKPTTAAAKPKAATTTPRPAGNGTSSQLGPRSPESVVFRFEAGRTSWSGTSNGVQLAVGIDKATPRAGEPVVFTLTAGSTTYPCCGFYITFGDGTSWAKDNGWGCPGGPPGPATRTTQTTQVFNKAGRWEFVFSGITGNCGTSGVSAHMYAWIEVAPGTSTSQGPQQPTIVADRYGPAPHWDEPGYVTVYGRARDEDGYISKLVVDYGDGTTEQFPGDASGCRTGSGGWPGASMAWTPTDPPPTHQYANPGTYKVTVTGYSQGCDGRDVQSVSASFEHSYFR